MDSNPMNSAGCLPAKELKRRARAILTGHYMVPMSAFALSQMIVMLINFPFELSLQKNPSVFQMVTSGLAGFIISLLSNVLTGGMISIHLNMADGKTANLSDVFRYFNRRPDRFILSGLLLSGISLLSMLPAIALTIFSVLTDTLPAYSIAALAWAVTLVLLFFIVYTYALAGYLLVEFPEAGIIDVFRQSRHMMKGRKKNRFCLGLSFIGMYVLSVLSAGIGFLWVIPYRNQTFAEFYRNIQIEP